jgi:ribosomal protein S19
VRERERCERERERKREKESEIERNYCDRKKVAPYFVVVAFSAFEGRKF